MKDKSVHIHLKALTGLSSGNYVITALRNAATVYPGDPRCNTFTKGMHVGDPLTQEQADNMCLVKIYEVHISN